mgnify:CR=1 FL=1
MSKNRIVTLGEQKVTKVDYAIHKENWVSNGMGMFTNTVPYPAGISARRVCYVENIGDCMFVNTHSKGITFFADRELETFDAKMIIFTSEYMPVSRYNVGG